MFAAGGDVIGGYAEATAGTANNTRTATATASDNNVNISSTIATADITGNIFGGHAIATNGINEAAASDNEVNISGMTRITGDIFGGCTIATGGIANAIDNLVTISGQATFRPTTGLYGGYIDGTGDDRTGNTLKLYTPVAVQTAQNFENWYFFQPDNMPENTAMLTATGAVGLGNDTHIKRVGISGHRPLFDEDQEILLIDAAGGITGTLNTTEPIPAWHGATILYDLTGTTVGLNTLTTKIDKVGVRPEAKTLTTAKGMSIASSSNSCFCASPTVDNVTFGTVARILLFSAK